MLISMAGAINAGTPGGGKPQDSPGEQGGLATQTRKKLERPRRYKVILYNDDYTPMEFVVMLLERVFEKSPSAASQLMLQIHRSGQGVGGVFVLEVAETKVSTVHKLAEDRGYPLRAGIEEE